MKTNILSVLLVVFAFACQAQAALTSNEVPYYGEQFYHDLASGVSNDDLKQSIQTVMRSWHRAVPGTYDQVSSSCSGAGCYNHISLGYDRARIWMMGGYYLTQENGEYAIPDVYCGGLKYAHQFGSNPPAPRQIPDGNVLNTEHTWPQSKFSGRYDKNMQKSDLHHLYPADNNMNSARGNLEFGEVVKDSKILKCPVSRVGKSSGGGAEVFQPPAEHRGNVARALFYFSVHYGLAISDQQEATLRKWNREDPVDEEEMHRNDEIQKVQGNRNPFVDFPELADRISNF